MWNFPLGYALYNNAIIFQVYQSVFTTNDWAQLSTN